MNGMMTTAEVNDVALQIVLRESIESNEKEEKIRSTRELFDKEKAIRQVGLQLQAELECQGNFYGPTMLQAVHALDLAPCHGGTSSYHNQCALYVACKIMGDTPMPDEPQMRFTDEQVEIVRTKIITYALANFNTMVTEKDECLRMEYRTQIDDWNIPGAMIKGDLFWQALANLAKIRITLYSYDTTTEAQMKMHVYQCPEGFKAEERVLHLHNHYTALCETAGILAHYYKG
jgi:hypothetical protein